MIKHISIILALLTLPMLTVSQEVNTLYFLENSTLRHRLNPAFMPQNKFYLGILGNSSAMVQSPLTLHDVIQTDQYNNSTTILHPSSSPTLRQRMLGKLSRGLSLQTQSELLAFGWKANNAYWHVSLQQKTQLHLNVPQGLFKLLVSGMDKNTQGDYIPTRYDLSTLGINAFTYTEMALGYAQKINDKLTIGGKAKWLVGNVAIRTTNEEIDITLDPNQGIKLVGNGHLHIAAPIQNRPSSITKMNELKFGNTGDWLKPQGGGLAIDLGATYQLLDILNLSCSLTDLGFVNWKNTTTIDYNIEHTIAGVSNINSKTDFKALGDSIGKGVENALISSVKDGNMKTGLRTKLNIGSEVSLLSNKIALGLFSKTAFQPTHTDQEFTLGAGWRPSSSFNFATSYSLLNGQFSNIGLGIGLNFSVINLTLAADYIPLYYEQSNRIPSRSNTINFLAGVHFTL